ncbi:MAG TPA: glycosyltransferase [Acidimicrobiales bacterium]|nr:glycosyltransferase [Acidimicrobiales bacterium]
MIDSLAPGGAERSLVDMAPHLVSAGIRLEVAVLNDRSGLGPELEGIGVPVTVVDGDGRAAWLGAMVRMLRRRRPDVVHTTLFESDIVGRTAAALVRVPVVSSLVNTPYGREHASEAGVGRVRLAGAHAADAATARVVRRFHAVSEPTAAICVARLRLRPDRVEVIPRGRDLARMGPPSQHRRQAARQAVGIASNTPVVLAVGRQEPQKGLDVLVRAVPAVLLEEPSIQVLVAGPEGRATPELRGLVTEVGVGGAIRFLGAREDVPDLLCAADVFVLPSRREGLPGAVLEAMAMEVPIVAADLPTVREAIPDEACGLLVPTGDPAALSRALLRVLADRSGARRRVDVARQRFADRFDIVSVSRAMVRFYETALANGPT